MEEPFRTLIWAATRAPSGDNTQPWRFVVEPEARRVSLYVDEARDPSPMNAGQRMSRIAVGAALENLLRASQNVGYPTELELPTDGAAAVVRIGDREGNEGEVDPAIAARVTNRRRYDGRPMPSHVIAELERGTGGLDGIRPLWISEADCLRDLATLIGRADALMLSEPSMRRAFLDNVRFDAPANAEVDEGLPIGSLELSAAQRVALRALPRTPDWLLKGTGAPRQFASAARRLVASASGLCLITEEGDAPQAEVLAGRAMQRAWLAMAAQGLAVQPMMSLPILENVRRQRTTHLLQSLGRERVIGLLEESRALLPGLGRSRLAFIMRFGFAPRPTSRTGRLPLDASTSQIDACEGVGAR